MKPGGVLQLIQQSDQELKRLMTCVADASLSYPAYQYKTWGYGEWIALEGLLSAARICADPKYLEFVEGLVGGWISSRTELIPADHVAPGVVLVRLYEITGQESYLERALALAALLLGSPRSTRGAACSGRTRMPMFTLIASIRIRPSSANWVSSLATGSRFGSCGIHTEILGCSGRSGAFASLSRLQRRDPAPIGLLWGRGAGWALLGLVDELRICP